MYIAEKVLNGSISHLLSLHCFNRCSSKLCNVSIMPVPAVSNISSLQCVMGMIGYTEAPGLSLIKERTFCCISEHVNKLGYFSDYRYNINGLPFKNSPGRKSSAWTLTANSSAPHSAFPLIFLSHPHQAFLFDCDNSRSQFNLAKLKTLQGNTTLYNSLACVLQQHKI